MEKSSRQIGIINKIKDLAQQISDDKVTVYAAQASFFVIISVVPLLSLAISIISFFVPSNVQQAVDTYTIPDSMATILGSALYDLKAMPNVSLLSISAITTLWTASKGFSAIRRGIETVYHAKSSKNVLFHWIKSLINTLVFIIFLLAIVALLLFGSHIEQLLRINNISDALMELRLPFFVFLMCIMFTGMYASTAKRSMYVESRILTHIPGALFASLGWIMFSYFYSLYIKYFPSASYIYGGLAAICLIMLWLYFCMIILLLGAEVNKLYYRLLAKLRRRKSEKS
ncbi:MAG: YihY/virulence factor BrkB family protein [Lachnospiraceae bacterium]